ncbi:Tubby-like F-box protein 2 [Hibiscus syriacus]|uniref:Tubby-like F-box protein 2 n=1 Tax=Hibiscus syriacus TaxID=106335 RepID=A0A6A2ZS96_HIBSY|nr:Tubby-like F-box protein 2 [Hibiscus syriacus]
MNDLMTKSFLSYVELKKQTQRDLESELDVEKGIGKGKLNPIVEINLSQFFQEVASIKITMEGITNLVFDLQTLNEETKSSHSAKVLLGLRDRMEADTVSILQKAKLVKEKLESLDRSNANNRRLSDAYREGTYVDRTRVSVTNGLRANLKRMMNDFNALREKILSDHKEDLKRRYYDATGEDMVEKTVSCSGEHVRSLAEIFEMDSRNKERHEAVMDIRRSLERLHLVFLDMAVLVEAQGEKMDDIEENLANAADFISGGTNQLYYANQTKKKKTACLYWVCGVVLIILLVCIISMEKAGGDGREDQSSALKLVVAVAPALQTTWFLPFCFFSQSRALSFSGSAIQLNIERLDLVMLIKDVTQEYYARIKGNERGDWEHIKGGESKIRRSLTRSHVAPDRASTVSESVDQSPWANLPPELLLDIIQRVEHSETAWPARTVVLSCAAVCRSWREITKEIVKTPEQCGRLTFPISLKQPGPRDSPIQCYIRRDRATSTYHLFCGLMPSEGKNDKFLLAARKVRRATCTDFIISMAADEFSKANYTYVGTVTYELNVLRKQGPRRMHCVLHSIPVSAIQEEGTAPTPLAFSRSFDKQLSSLTSSKGKEPVANTSSPPLPAMPIVAVDSGEPLTLKNKAPIWHEQLQCWCLDFKGRVTVASVKNFQLVTAGELSHNISPEEQEKVILQFGKIGKDIFTMDYRYPLSTFQAFAICLSSFDTKPVCE